MRGNGNKSGCNPKASNGYNMKMYYHGKGALIICLLYCMISPTIYAGDIAITKTIHESCGFITRTQNSTRRVIFQPIDGIFKEGIDVSYYDLKGQLICKGRVQSVYKDEIYSIAEDCNKFEFIGEGMVVAINGDASDIISIYNNREKLEALSIDRAWNRLAGVPMDLGEDQYDKMVLKSSVPVLVEFYTTWCPYCQKTIPKLGEIAKDLEGKVRIATFDKEINSKLSSDMNVKSVPAFFLIKDGKILGNWKGAIDNKESVIKYLNSKLKLN